jgi:hypothetical protein
VVAVIAKRGFTPFGWNRHSRHVDRPSTIKTKKSILLERCGRSRGPYALCLVVVACIVLWLLFCGREGPPLLFWNSGQRGDADDADDDLLVRSQTGDPDRYCARNVGHNNIGEKQNRLRRPVDFITHNRFPDSCASSLMGRQHGDVRAAPFSLDFVDRRVVDGQVGNPDRRSIRAQRHWQLQSERLRQYTNA